MFSAENALMLFAMLAISSISVFIAQRLRVPHTVFLVLVGVVLATLSLYPPLHFLGGLELTPELLFFFFLPTLIFEAAYNIPVKHLTDDAPIIGVLAIVSILVSTILIAFGLDVMFNILSLDIPFILSLMFGAIISATDPVAVLALFKEYGAPRRLSLIFEGESIFNDGTGVALFLVILAIAESGVMSSGDILTGALSFAGMVLGGVLFGLIFGGVFAKLVGYTRNNEFASITLTIVLAHTTFIGTELWNHHVTIGGHHVLISSIIATAVASLLMGNYGRYKLPQHAHEFVEKYWSHFAFLANSLIFIMIGMLVVKLPLAAKELIIPITLTILIVATARAISIYPVVSLFNAASHAEKKVPLAWQHILAWGSLRGALAVTMVLLIPDTLSFPGWNLPFTPKEFVLTLTVSCVFATLFIKATTIGSFMHKLKLSTFTDLEEINYREMLVHIYSTTLKRLKESFEKGYIDNDVYTTVVAEQRARMQSVLVELQQGSHDPRIVEKVIRLYAIGIERKHIKALYANHEVPESVIKRIMGKLEFQTHAIEHDTFDPDTCEHGRTRDVFEYLADTLSFRRKTSDDIVRETYLYYRALSIVSRKVVKELRTLDSSFDSSYNASHDAAVHVLAIYERYQNGSNQKMQELAENHTAIITPLNEQLARYALFMREENLLSNLRSREMVTPKVSIALDERFKAEASELTHS